VIEATSAAVPQAGDWIGLDDRAHQVYGAWPDESGEYPNRWTLAINPPVRATLAAGENVEVADPFCKMQLADRDRVNGAEIDFNRMGRVSLTFVESNWLP
jgi:hypothetical protein